MFLLDFCGIFHMEERFANSTQNLDSGVCLLEKAKLDN